MTSKPPTEQAQEREKEIRNAARSVARDLMGGDSETRAQAEHWIRQQLAMHDATKAHAADRQRVLEAELERLTGGDWVDDAACHDKMCSYRAEHDRITDFERLQGDLAESQQRERALERRAVDAERSLEDEKALSTGLSNRVAELQAENRALKAAIDKHTRWTIGATGKLLDDRADEWRRDQKLRAALEAAGGEKE